MELKNELKHSDIENCALCYKGVAHDNSLIFYRVTIETYGLEIANINRQTGLEIMLGGHASLANVMGPDAPIATRVHDPEPKLVCLSCLIDGATLAQLIEEK